MTNEELTQRLQKCPKNAEVLIVVGDAEDYVPIGLAGYAKNLDVILIQPVDERF